MKNFTLLILIVISLGSCNAAYYTVLRTHNVKNKEYFGINDTISISHVVLCNGYGEGFSGPIEFSPINEDSTMAYFKNALSSTNLNVKFSEQLQYSCNSYIKKGRDYLQPLSQEYLMQLARENPHRYKIIPVIGYLTSDVDVTSFTLSAGTPISKLNRYLSLSITVYIFEEDNVVYSKSMFVRPKIRPIMTDMRGKVFDYRSKKPYVSTLEQKHWDKLVEKTMKDFIKRMKDEEN